jgi:hypothetical protein
MMDSGQQRSGKRIRHTIEKYGELANYPQFRIGQHINAVLPRRLLAFPAHGQR